MTPVRVDRRTRGSRSKIESCTATRDKPWEALIDVDAHNSVILRATQADLLPAVARHEVTCRLT